MPCAPAFSCGRPSGRSRQYATPTTRALNTSVDYFRFARDPPLRKSHTLDAEWAVVTLRLAMATTIFQFSVGFFWT